MMHRLYGAVLDCARNKRDLYMRLSGDAGVTEGRVVLPTRGSSVDFTTCFNGFSPEKWRRYTTLRSVTIRCAFSGDLDVRIASLGGAGGLVDRFTARDGFERTYALDTLGGSVLGVAASCMGSPAVISSLEYLGETDDWRDVRLGVVTCTYRRETFAQRTMRLLADFAADHDWLSALVVDNGSTLPEKDEGPVRLVHNENFGGAGGFTRGLIQNLEEDATDWVLLMDDDIELEPQALERTHSIACAVAPAYRDSFICGAMLDLDAPTIQYESTAHWEAVKLFALGRGLDLADPQALVSNEKVDVHPRQYGAWWFCAMPLQRVRSIGLPMPLFVKGDDMEYGIRNDREVIRMNGLCVWHKNFVEKKKNTFTNYFNDRNMFILSLVTGHGGRMALAAGILLRALRKVVNRDRRGYLLTDLALADALDGPQALTAVPAPEKAEQVRSYRGPGLAMATATILTNLVRTLVQYPAIRRSYLDFRATELSGTGFWKRYLGLHGREPR